MRQKIFPERLVRAEKRFSGRDRAIGSVIPRVQSTTRTLIAVNGNYLFIVRINRRTCDIKLSFLRSSIDLYRLKIRGTPRESYGRCGTKDARWGAFTFACTLSEDDATKRILRYFYDG